MYYLYSGKIEIFNSGYQKLLLWLSNSLSDNANINSVTHLKDQGAHLH